MLGSLITDCIVLEVQCGDYLCEVVGERYKERVRMLLCFVVEH
jgi:hypothetical protein